MVRSFDRRAIASEVVERVLAAAARAPSAGNTQATALVVLEGADQTARYWDHTLPAERRAGFRWQGLLQAPVLILPVSDERAYRDRYAEPDKAATGLGGPAGEWPVPYWTVDAAFAAMLVLLAATGEGLGALFFGIFSGERALCADLGIPPGRVPIGTIALGWPAADEPGRSSTRRHRPLDEVIHRGGW